SQHGPRRPAADGAAVLRSAGGVLLGALAAPRAAVAIGGSVWRRPRAAAVHVYAGPLLRVRAGDWLAVGHAAASGAAATAYRRGLRLRRRGARRLRSARLVLPVPSGRLHRPGGIAVGVQSRARPPAGE